MSHTATAGTGPAFVAPDPSFPVHPCGLRRDCAVRAIGPRKATISRVEGGKKVGTIDRVDNAHSLHDKCPVRTYMGGVLLSGLPEPDRRYVRLGSIQLHYARCVYVVLVVASNRSKEKRLKNKDCNIPRTCGVSTTADDDSGEKNSFDANGFVVFRCIAGGAFKTGRVG